MRCHRENLATLTAALLLSTALSNPAFAQDQTDQADDGDVEEIIVTASKMDRKLEDMTSSIAVVTAADIEAQMVTDLNQLFNREPGVTVTGNSGQSQNVIVRGMGADRVLMIKDGMRMNEGYGADGLNDIVGRGFIDLDTVKQVEVAKGPASSLYGADAMGGIVVFTTKEAADYLDEGEDFYLGARTSYAGINSEVSTGVTAVYRTGKLDTLVSATQRQGHETQNFNEDKGTLNANSISLLAKTTFNINETSTLSLTFDLWDQNSAVPDSGAGDYGEWLGLSGYKIYFLDSYADRRNESWKAAYHYEGDMIDSLDVSFYRNQSEQMDGNTMKLDVNSIFGVFMRDFFIDGIYSQDTYGLLSNVVGSFDLGSAENSFAFGVDVEKTASGRTSREIRIQDGIETMNAEVNKFPDNDVKRFGIYLNDYIDFADGRFSINFGTRYDHFKMVPENEVGAVLQYDEITDGRLSSNAGAVFKATDNFSIVGNFSQGFKVPPYDLAYLFQDNWFVTFGWGYIVHPAESLVPETSNSFEVGVRFNTDRLNFNAYVFQNNFKNFIEIAFLYSELLFGFQVVDHFQYANIDSVRIKGAEASLSYRASDDLFLYANMTYQTGKDRGSDEYITSIEPLGGTLGASYSKDSYGLDLTMRWASKMKKVNAGRFVNPGYAVVDVTSYYELKEGIMFRLGVFNVLDTEYTEFKSVIGLDAGADANIRTRPGRNISAKMTLAF